MRIGEIARRAGVRPSAIRFYEKAGILPPALRKSGQRSFSAEAELYLGIIGASRKAGFPSRKSGPSSTGSAKEPPLRHDGKGSLEKSTRNSVSWWLS